MLASGDPIGDPEAWPGAIHAFLDEAARHAWVPAVIGCGEHGAEVWCREGDLTALELGDEAVVNLPDFTHVGPVHAQRAPDGLAGRPPGLRGRDPPGRRHARGRDQAARPAGRHAGGAARSSAASRWPWAGSAASATSAAWWPPPTRTACSRPSCTSCRGAPTACRWTSCAGTAAPRPGLNDFLIVETIKCGADLGVKRISLNFAVFRAALERGERIGAGPVLRAWRGC